MCLFILSRTTYRLIPLYGSYSIMDLLFYLYFCMD